MEWPLMPCGGRTYWMAHKLYPETYLSLCISQVTMRKNHPGACLLLLLSTLAFVPTPLFPVLHLPLLSVEGCEYSQPWRRQKQAKWEQIGKEANNEDRGEETGPWASSWHGVYTCGWMRHMWYANHFKSRRQICFCVAEEGLAVRSIAGIATVISFQKLPRKVLTKQALTLSYPPPPGCASITMVYAPGKNKAGFDLFLWTVSLCC